MQKIAKFANLQKISENLEKYSIINKYIKKRKKLNNK